MPQLKSVKKLDKSQLAFHLEGLCVLIRTTPRVGTNRLMLDPLQEHLEPLLLHYFWNCSQKKTAIILKEETAKILGEDCLVTTAGALGEFARRRNVPTPGKTDASKGRHAGVSRKWGAGSAFSRA